jgi:hypothetical protein
MDTPQSVCNIPSTAFAVQLWMAVLRYLAGAVVWLAVAAANLVLAGCTIYAFSLAGLLTKAGTWGEAVAAQLPPIADPTGAESAMGLLGMLIVRAARAQAEGQ